MASGNSLVRKIKQKRPNQPVGDHQGLLVGAAPMLWLIVFLCIPFFLIVKISLSLPVLSIPPYMPMIQKTAEGGVTYFISFDSYRALWQETIYAFAYLDSLKTALITTLGALLIGYPMAYCIATAPVYWQKTLLMLVILPFWVSFLLRVYGWVGILNENGLVNIFLQNIALTDRKVQFLQTDLALYMGMIYSYLPFMILPLYANLSALEKHSRDAASDLGAKPIRVFFTITLPLSKPGIIAGAILVFIPALGEYIVPTLFGSFDTLMIGRVLWDAFFANRNWPAACALTVSMLLLVFTPILLWRLLRRYFPHTM